MAGKRRKELWKLRADFLLLKDSRKINGVRACVQLLGIIGLSLLGSTFVLSWALSQMAALGCTVKLAHL